MEDSTAMTIEFLRARLLSERSVSRTARQRADELAKRVAGLEEQLKIVTLQRKKAEKATADVFAILKGHGISDVSDAFDSGSDQEASLCNSKVGKSSTKEEDSADVESRRKGMEASSGFEIESSSLIDKSLSWKSGKNSPHSIEKKKCVDSTRRRRSNFTSTGLSSPKCVGKSCRQIRRRETRSTVENLENDANICSLNGDGAANCLEGFSDYSNNGPEPLREGSQKYGEKELMEGPASGALEDQRFGDGPYFDGCADKDMERALEHQAQLIGQYEEEEKAQREWEEKFGVYNSCTPDSCEPGNHSDATVERDGVKAIPILSAVKMASHDLPVKSEAVDCVGEVSKTPNDIQSPAQVALDCLQNQKFSSTHACESDASECASPEAKGKHDHKCPENHPHQLSHSQCSEHGIHSPCAHGNDLAGTSSFYGGCSLSKGEVSGCGNRLALIPHETSDKLGSVLVALQQAKLSIKDKLNKSPSVGGRSFGNAIEPLVPAANAGDKLGMPIGCAGLFSLPTDFQFEATTGANFLVSGSQLSLANYSGTDTANNFFPSPYMNSIRSSASTDDRFLTTLISPYTEVSSGIPTGRPVLGPTMDAVLPSSIRHSYFNSHMSTPQLTSNKSTYPTYPFYRHPMSQMSQMLTNEELARPLQSREFGLAYDGSIRPSTYRQ